jgi:hypothetical protein
MSSIICFWKYKNYLEDGKQGILNKLPAFNSNQRRLHSATRNGDIAYLITYDDGFCYLVGRIVISRKRLNAPGYKYGQYRIEGDQQNSRYYSCGLIDLTNILRQLSFKSGKRIGNSQSPCSQHLQTIRELTDSDIALLESVIP